MRTFLRTRWVLVAALLLAPACVTWVDGADASSPCSGANCDASGDGDAGDVRDVQGDQDNDGHPAISAGGDDCDDTSADVHPGAADTACNGIDNDCDQATDEDFESSATTCGKGLCYSTGQTSCDEGVENDTCVEGNPDTEACNDLDDDCDGAVDNGCDDDGDGWCDAGMTVVDQPTICSNGLDDCDDTVATTHPAAADFLAGTCANLQMNPTTEIVDQEGNTGYYSAGAFGPDGTLYVVYRNSEPKKVVLAAQAPGVPGWTWYTVNSGAGQYLDLAIANGTVHVSFYDESSCKCLKYAHNSLATLGGAWTVETIDKDAAGAEVGRYSSIAVDAQGAVHLAYWDKTGNNLKYATNATGAFVVEIANGADVVDGEEEKIGQFASLGLDAGGFAHVATYFETGSSLAYLTNKSGAWARTIVDNDGQDVGKYAALAVDKSSAVHVAYRYSSEEDLRYATNASGAWKAETVDGRNVKVGSYVSLALDADDKAHISYNQGDLDFLRYATNAPGYWVAAVVEDSYKCGLQTSIALGPDNAAHIFSGHNALKKMLHTTTTLACLELGSSADGNCDGIDGLDDDQDGFASLASGGSDCNDDDPTIQPAWVTTMLDPGPNVGQYASLAIDASNLLHAAYYDAAGRDLRYARLNVDGSWTREVADASPHDVGKYSSIAVAGGDAPSPSPVVHIAYYDATSSELLHATNAGGAWATELVEGTPDGGDVGTYASIALDDDDGVSVHIAYHDAIQGLLRYATNRPVIAGDPPTWRLATIPYPGLRAGAHASLVVHDGVVHVAFQDVTNADLVYAVGNDDTWVVTPVETVDDVGEVASLAVDSGHVVHIVYRKANDHTLLYARGDGAAWSSLVVDDDADVGKSAAIALDSNSMVHAVYRDQAANVLRYATNVVLDGGQWMRESVSTSDGAVCGGLTTSCGAFAALRFDPMGALHAVHYDDANERLLYSRKYCLGY